MLSQESSNGSLGSCVQTIHGNKSKSIRFTAQRKHLKVANILNIFEFIHIFHHFFFFFQTIWLYLEHIRIDWIFDWKMENSIHTDYLKTFPVCCRCRS